MNEYFFTLNNDMTIENFVVLVLCSGATLENLIHERKRFNAVAVDIVHFDHSVNYADYKRQYFDSNEQKVKLMFVFKRFDSLIVTCQSEMNLALERIDQGHC